MIKLLWLLMYLVNASGTPSNMRVDLVRSLAGLHELDWSNLDVQTAEKRLGIPLMVTEAEIPVDSKFRDGSCDASVYGMNTSSAGSLRLEFRKSIRSDGKCAVSLYSVRLEINVPASAAEKLRLDLTSALQAAGKTCEPQVTEYRWRSDDSRTLFSLAMGVAESDQQDRLPLLSAWLRHIPVTPSMVDDLPFHKGFISPLGSTALDR